MKINIDKIYYIINIIKKIILLNLVLQSMRNKKKM